MTIYNWRREGLHPRLLAWRWAARKADRRWYISEFVWDTWESKRKKGSARLPVVSQMPTGEVAPCERRGFLFAGRWIPNKGLRILLKAYHRLAPNPDTWPLILLGDGPLRQEVERLSRKVGREGFGYLDSFPKKRGFGGHAKQSGWSRHPIPAKIWGSRPWRPAPLASLA